MTETIQSSMSDIYTNGPYGSFLEELRVPKSRTPLSLIRFSQPAGDFSDPACADLVLVTPLIPATGEFDLGGGRHHAKVAAQSLFLVPAYVPATFILEGRNTGMGLGIRQSVIQPWIDEAAGRPLPDFGILHREGFRDDFCRRLLTAIWDEAEADNPAGALFIDGAVMSLIARLVTLSQRQRPVTGKGRVLDAARLRQVSEHVEAHLGDGTCIGDLAALVGMRDYEFARAFKSATKVAPYQFVLDRRIDRAKGLLSNGADALADVAFACGFASQSHMTDVFRAKVGVTPGRYRRDRRT